MCATQVLPMRVGPCCNLLTGKKEGKKEERRKKQDENFYGRLCNRADHIYFHPVSFFFLFSSFFISSPNLSGRRLDVYHTSTHGVALVRN